MTELKIFLVYIYISIIDMHIKVFRREFILMFELRVHSLEEQGKQITSNENMPAGLNVRDLATGATQVETFDKHFNVLTDTCY